MIAIATFCSDTWDKLVYSISRWKTWTRLNILHPRFHRRQAIRMVCGHILQGPAIVWYIRSISSLQGTVGILRSVCNSGYVYIIRRKLVWTSLGHHWFPAEIAWSVITPSVASINLVKEHGAKAKCLNVAPRRHWENFVSEIYYLVCSWYRFEIQWDLVAFPLNHWWVMFSNTRISIRFWQSFFL